MMHHYSLNQLYLLCHVTLAVRLLAYCLCTDASGVWWIYVVQSLHGINFGVGFSVVTIYLQQIADIYSDQQKGVSIKATAQSLKGIIILCRGITGSLIWLPIYETFGAQIVYFMGALSIVPSIVYLCCVRSADKRLLNVKSYLN